MNPYYSNLYPNKQNFQGFSGSGLSPYQNIQFTPQSNVHNFQNFNKPNSYHYTNNQGNIPEYNYNVPQKMQLSCSLENDNTFKTPHNYWEPNKPMQEASKVDSTMKNSINTKENIINENLNVVKERHTICEICNTEKHKYKCPSCGILSCSLKCTKAHKSMKKCDGIFKTEKFISKTDFTEKIGIKDYNFLNGMIGNIDKVKKHLSLLKRQGSSAGEALRYKLLRVFSKKMHNIDLQLLPFVFTRHRENISFYYTKKKKIFWSLEILIYDPKDNQNNFVRFLSLKPVNEELIMKEALDEFNLFKEDMLVRRNLNLEKENLKIMIEENKILLFKEEIGENGNKNSFLEVSLNNRIEELLKSQKIIEFPKFYIVFVEDKEMFNRAFAVKFNL